MESQLASAAPPGAIRGPEAEVESPEEQEQIPHPDDSADLPGKLDEVSESDEPAPKPEVELAKKKSGWSDDQHAAAAERMRSRQVSGLMKGRKKEAAPTQQSEPIVEAHVTLKPELVLLPKPPTAIDPTRLITVHNGYAGKRKDGQLNDDDWPHLKARFARGDTRRAIASDYDAELEDLESFISSNERREAKQPPGEACTPLPRLTGGAS